MNSITLSTTQVNVSAQGGLLKIKLPMGRPGTGGVRGKVTAFSRASRKRLIELFASLNIDYTKPPKFITLTYPDEALPDDPSVYKKHLKAFQERLRRRFPEMSAIWRMEVEPRKSGKYVGREVPHYHLAAVNMPYLKFEEIRDMWKEVIGSPVNPRVRIEKCQNRRKAFAYISKYVAKMVDKVPDLEEVEEAPPAGFNEDGADENALSLSIAHNGTLGRWWGVFNRGFLPFGELIEGCYQIPAEVFYAFRRDARKIYEEIGMIRYVDESGKLKRKSVCDKGFTLFVENSYRWLVLLGHYLNEFCTENGIEMSVSA